MKTYIFVTDSHFRIKAPINRTDNILESLLIKFEWVLKRAKELNAEIIHGGDMFHTPSIPDWIAIKIIKLIKSYKRKIYFIIGNHDVTGGNSEAYDFAKIGLFAEHDWFTLIAPKPIIFDNHIICGYDFSKTMECPEIIDPCRDFNLGHDKPIICCVHSMITDEPSVNVDGNYRTIRWNVINSTADLILTGHYHPGFEIQENKLGVKFANPGAMIRQEGSKIDINRIPRVAVIHVRKNGIEIGYENIPHRKDVFNLDQITMKFDKEFEKQQFIEALQSLSDEELMGDNIISILDELSKKKLPEDIKELLNKDILKKCKDKILEIKESG